MKLTAFVVTATLAAGASFAGGYQAPVVEETVAPAAAAGADWTGFYAGLQFGQGDLSAERVGSVEQPRLSTDIDALGVHVGYLRDFGNFVAGAELAYDNVDADGPAGSADLLRLRARLGYDLGRFLPYLNLGMARLSDSGESANGMTYGIGADYLVTDRISLGLEYSRTEFDDVLPGIDGEMDLIQIRASYHF